MSTLLWLVWGFAFLVLELVGLDEPDDDDYTLTNRVRALMRGPAGKLVRLALFAGWVWLGWHFFGVDATTNPGA